MVMDYYNSMAEKIYDAGIDMDFMDYAEYADMEIKLLADELQKMDKSDSILYMELERIFT